CDQPGIGFAAINASGTALVRNATGTGVTKVSSSLTAPSTDLFRRAQPGQTIKIAAYELGANAPEFSEMAAAVGRGVKAMVVLNSEYSAPTVAALQSLANANPGMVQVKLSKSHVMHEKFGLVGDDV